MEKTLFDEMIKNVNIIDEEIGLAERKIFLFGHCSATLELVDHLEAKGLSVTGILDNSDVKQGLKYKGTTVISPKQILGIAGGNQIDDSVVLISSRFYSEMVQQLRELGYEGPIRKVIDYNTYSDYSLSEETMLRMKTRERQGEYLLQELSKKHADFFKVFCPFNALGDIYFMISFWDSFAKKRAITKAVFCVVSKNLADVIHMFGDYSVEIYDQKKLDSMIQAAIYMQDKNTFIAHQDRPYVVNLSKALYIKKIPLEQIYCCGVYGLPPDTKPSTPINNIQNNELLRSVPKGRTVIFSPYAKSVPAIDPEVWIDAVNYYKSYGYKCFTNVIGDEEPIEGTIAISPSILEMRSVVEKAGTFIGIRSGLCDILRGTKARKIALYPDYNYCDTKWKAIEMYSIEEFDHNILVTEEIEWEKL